MSGPRRKLSAGVSRSLRHRFRTSGKRPSHHSRWAYRISPLPDYGAAHRHDPHNREQPSDAVREDVVARWRKAAVLRSVVARIRWLGLDFRHQTRIRTAHHRRVAVVVEHARIPGFFSASGAFFVLG